MTLWAEPLPPTLDGQQLDAPGIEPAAPAMKSPSRLAPKDYPYAARVASRIAASAQRTFKHVIRIGLGLVLVAAVLSALAGVVAKPWVVPVSVASAISLGLAVILDLVPRQFRLERRWYEHRGVAESLKTATWRYMMRVVPYHNQLADAAFQVVVGEAQAIHPDLYMRRGQGGAIEANITDVMRFGRELDLPSRRLLYLEARLGDQREWYTRKSDENRRSATIWFWVGLGARLIAFTSAIAYIVDPNLPHLTEVFAALAATLAAWLQLGRHEELSESYGLAARELSLLGVLVENAETEEEFTRRVAETESAVSREHTVWMAKRL